MDILLILVVGVAAACWPMMNEYLYRQEPDSLTRALIRAKEERDAKWWKDKELEIKNCNNSDK